MLSERHHKSTSKFSAKLAAKSMKLHTWTRQVCCQNPPYGPTVSPAGPSMTIPVTGWLSKRSLYVYIYIYIYHEISTNKPVVNVQGHYFQICRGASQELSLGIIQVGYFHPMFFAKLSWDDILGMSFQT